MSRIGIKPVAIPAKVEASLSGSTINVEGPKGKLDYTFNPEIEVEVDEEAKLVRVSRNVETKEARAYHGLTRALIANMMEGVLNGYEKKLEVVGVGYVASISGNTLSLRVGFANEIKRIIPKELEVTCPDQTHIVVRGCDKQKVGQFAAEVRASRKPEPYKGKGVRYEGEHVKIKPGKSAT